MDSFRQSWRLKFGEIIGEYCRKNSIADKNPADYARRVERSIFNKTVSYFESRTTVAFNQKFTTHYEMIAGNILQNMSGDSEIGDPSAAMQIVFLDPNNIAAKSDRELCPQSSAAIRDYIEKRKKIEVTKKTANIQKCKKCGSGVTWDSRQNRASDELTAIIFTCVNQACGYRWQ